MSERTKGLRLWVIGGRLGESIVLSAPGGEWGVIDAYASSPDDPTSNPTLTRLNEMRVQALAFVCLTHPHMDHFRGLRGVLTQYSGRVRQFWRPPFGTHDLARIASRLLDRGEAAQYKFERLEAKEAVIEFRKLFDHVAEQKKKGAIETLMTQRQTLLFEDKSNDFEIMCLAPSSDLSTDYFEQMARPLLGNNRLTVNAEHNLISSVLVIRYRQWHGVLAGDAEQPTWNSISQYHQKKPLGNVRFLKISHHGSMNGHPTPLWGELFRRRPHAALTCYAAQKLPTAEGLAKYRTHCASVHASTASLALSMAGCPVPISLAALSPAERGEVAVSVAPSGNMKITHIGDAGPV